MKTSLLSLTLALGLLPAAALAQEPVVNVIEARHQYLEDAQQFSRKAYDQLTNAQKYNHYDMKGHAERAKQLLVQVNQEIRAATDAANAADAQRAHK